MKEIYGPIYVNENVRHSYQEHARPDHLQPKHLKGPIYINDDTRHQFSQIEEHLESLKSLTAPIYNVESRSLFQDIQEHVESLKSLQGPVYEFGESGHKFEGGQNLLPPSMDKKTLHGPKYEVESDHHFSEIVKQCDSIKELIGPIYEVGETSHSFRELTQHVESLKTLAASHPIFMAERHLYGEVPKNADELVKFIHGPIYVKENVKHSYQEQSKPDDLQAKTLMGPIYVKNNYRHHFQQIDQHIESLKNLKGPVYDVESKNHYKGIMEHVESIKSFQGPIYNFGETSHNFIGSQILLPPPVEKKTLHGPKYHIDSDHHFTEIVDKVDKLKELVGPIYDVGDTGHHFKELGKHVESLRTLMHPIFMDERHRYGIL